MDSLKKLQQDFLQNIMDFTEKTTDIYQNNYKMGLIKTLSATYPVCERLVGKSFFNQLAKQYIMANPSMSFSLDDYGDKFSEFSRKFLEKNLKEFSKNPAVEQTAPNLPDLPDLSYFPFVAELEWAISRVEIGKKEETFDWNLLVNIPQDKQSEVILHRRQNSKMLFAPYPIDRIWQTNQPEFQSKSAWDDIVDLSEGEVYLFIYREDIKEDSKYYDICIDRLSKLDWEILSNIDGKTSLAELLTRLGETSPKAHAVESQLPYYIKRGYVSGFSLN